MDTYAGCVSVLVMCCMVRWCSSTSLGTGRNSRSQSIHKIIFRRFWRRYSGEESRSFSQTRLADNLMIIALSVVGGEQELVIAEAYIFEISVRDDGSIGGQFSVALGPLRP